MKLWIDDVREAPSGYVHARSVNHAKQLILKYSNMLDWDMNPTDMVELIDIDHDAGAYAIDGGDYIKLLDWMEEIGYTPQAIHIHSMNPVGIQNMRRIIQKNHWREV